MYAETDGDLPAPAVEAVDEIREDSTDFEDKTLAGLLY